MSDIVNPYKSPEMTVVPDSVSAGQGTLTEIMLIQLKGASPWLRFVGIIGFIGAGFTILSGFLFFAMAYFFTLSLPELGSLYGSMGMVSWVFFALFFIIVGGIMFLPSFFTYRFGDKIRGYLRTGSEQELEAAFKNNRFLWKCKGIICIVQLSFVPLMLIGSIITIVFSVISQ